MHIACSLLQGLSRPDKFYSAEYEMHDVTFYFHKCYFPFCVNKVLFCTFSQFVFVGGNSAVVSIGFDLLVAVSCVESVNRC